ncbi:hypothetical protein GJQ54_04605 [Oceanospirillaceae bacterium ASx5O]|nr:hypothetical protein GJQ54_04605 [Oceanospirillaceae bacterium ASx5O]
MRHDPRPVHPGGPVNDGSFRRAIGANKTLAATPAKFKWACYARKAKKPKSQKAKKPKSQKAKKPKKQKARNIIPAAGRKNLFRLLRFFPAHSGQPDVYQSQ